MRCASPALLRRHVRRVLPNFTDGSTEVRRVETRVRHFLPSVGRDVGTAADALQATAEGRRDCQIPPALKAQRVGMSVRRRTPFKLRLKGDATAKSLLPLKPL